MIKKNKLLYKDIKDKYVILCTFFLCMWGIFVFCLREIMPVNQFMKFCTLSSFFIFLIEIYFIYKLTDELFHPSIIFLLSYYVFQNGQLLLLALDIPFNTFYINSLIHLLPKVTLFSSISTVIAGFSAVFFIKGKDFPKEKVSFVENYDSNSIAHIALVGLIVVSLIDIPLVLIKFFGYAVPKGYYAVRDFESTLPSIIGLIDYMYIPFTLLYIVFSKNKVNNFFVKVLLFCWSILNALCGDRTTGIAGLMIIFIYDYMIIQNPHDKKRMALKIIFVGIVCMILIKIAFAFRIKGDYSSIFDGGLISGFLAELGGSVFPLFTMMEVVPTKESFLYGAEYIQSFINGFFPSTLDIFGIIKSITPLSDIYNDWIYKYFSQYTFGLGFSLNAEAYINFGWYGEIFIFFIIGFVSYNLTNNYVSTGNSNKFGIYKILVLLFAWFTLPRRSTYYIWNNIFWNILIISLYIKLFALPSKFLHSI